MKRLLVFLCASVLGMAGINGTAHASSWSLLPSGTVDTTGLSAGSQVDVELFFNYTGDIVVDFEGIDLDFQIDLAEVTPELDIFGDPNITWHLDGWLPIATQIVGNTVSYAGGNLFGWNSWSAGSNLVATIPLLTVGTAQPCDGVGDFDLLDQTGFKGIADYPLGNIDNFAGAAGPDYGVVPIPSAIWLLVSGLIGLVGFRKKIKR